MDLVTIPPRMEVSRTSLVSSSVPAVPDARKMGEWSGMPQRVVVNRVLGVYPIDGLYANKVGLVTYRWE